MLRRRVMPCLDVANGRVVKGTQFVDLVDEGDPPELAERYAREGADELVFLDITASPEGRGTLLDIVERTARRAFIPLTVGGGVRSVADMRDVLRAGADKVSLNTAAVADPTLVSRCAARFGRQAVVVAIDARRIPVEPPSGPAGRSWSRAAGSRPGSMPWPGRSASSTSAPASCWSPRSIATDPLRLRHRAPAVDRGSRPGARHRVRWRGRPDDFVAAVRDGGADAVLAASIFHRRLHSIGEVKRAMAAAGLPVRLVEEAAA